MALTQEMLAALAETGHIVGPVLTITLPAGLGAELGLPDDELRIAAAPFCSDDEGYFDARAYKFGISLHALSDRNGNIRGWQITVTMCDLPETDAPEARSIGPFGRAISMADLRGAVAVVRGAAEGVDAADWYVDRVGVLADWAREGETGWRWEIKPDDEPMKRAAPRLKLTTGDWPDAFTPPKDQAQTVIGQYAPIALGRVNSEGIGDHGLRRTLLVDVARHWYLVSLGTISGTGFRVFVDGVETVSGWTRQVISRAGRTWTVVEFASALTDEQVVTVDCQGLDLGSYGTYTHPAAQYRWGLEHLVYASWNGGALLTPTHTDAASFAAVATMLGSREGAPGWLTLGLEVSGEEMTRRFITATGVDVYWTKTGTIGVSLIDLMALDADETANVILQGQDTTGPLQLLTPPTEEQWRAVTINWLQGPDGQGQAELSVCHPGFLDAPPKAITSQWAGGRAV